MADIFVEVDEAMKQERIEKLWQRYGGFFIGFLAVIVLGTAANAGYKSWVTSKNAAQTSLLLDVMDKKTYSATELLEITPDLDHGLRGVVEMQAAGLSLKNNDKEEALKSYNALADDKNIDPAISKLAGYILIHISENITPRDKLLKLNMIISEQTNPWRFHALLDSALLEANENNDFTKAREHLATILKAETVPQTMKQKAQSLDILYALKEKI